MTLRAVCHTANTAQLLAARSEQQEQQQPGGATAPGGGNGGGGCPDALSSLDVLQPAVDVRLMLWILDPDDPVVSGLLTILQHLVPCYLCELGRHGRSQRRVSLRPCPLAHIEGLYRIAIDTCVRRSSPVP